MGSVGMNIWNSTARHWDEVKDGLPTFEQNMKA